MRCTSRPGPLALLGAAARLLADDVGITLVTALLGASPALLGQALGTETAGGGAALVLAASLPMALVASGLMARRLLGLDRGSRLAALGAAVRRLPRQLGTLVPLFLLMVAACLPVAALVLAVAHVSGIALTQLGDGDVRAALAASGAGIAVVALGLTAGLVGSFCLARTLQANEILACEDVGIWAALRLSWARSRGRLWGFVGARLLLLAAGLGLGAAVGGLYRVTLGPERAGVLGDLAVALLLTPLAAALDATWYRSARLAAEAAVAPTPDTAGPADVAV